MGALFAALQEVIECRWPADRGGNRHRLWSAVLAQKIIPPPTEPPSSDRHKATRLTSGCHPKVETRESSESSGSVGSIRKHRVSPASPKNGTPAPRSSAVDIGSSRQHTGRPPASFPATNAIR